MNWLFGINNYEKLFDYIARVETTLGIKITYLEDRIHALESELKLMSKFLDRSNIKNKKMIDELPKKKVGRPRKVKE